MTDRIIENADRIVDEMRRKARRRLVGAIVLALAAAIILPMLLEKEPRPLGDDVTVKIPPVDEGKFINKLTGKSSESTRLPKADDKPDAKATPARSEPRSETGAPSSAAAPVASAAPESGAKKSSTETPDRAIAPPAKSTAKNDADSAPAAPAEPKPEAKSAAADASAASADDTAAAANGAATQAAPASATQPASPSAPSARADGFVVQLAAFADDKGANSLANKLKRAGYAAFVEPVNTSRGTLWRVRVGGYGSKPEADAARAKLKGEGYSGIVAPAS
jgi:DedD protein